MCFSENIFGHRKREGDIKKRESENRRESREKMLGVNVTFKSPLKLFEYLKCIPKYNEDEKVLLCFLVKKKYELKYDYIKNQFSF